MDRKFEITDAKGGAAFTVRVVTRAENAEIVGMQEDGTVKVRLKADSASAPEANKELIEFLASQLGVEKERFEIVAGENKIEKLISVEGITTAEVEAKFGKTDA
jgi:uncharacterized protein YggU (UPF0235/DUF167 family)